MKWRKPTIRVSGAEEKILQDLYLKMQVPSDQLTFRRNKLDELTKEWNSATRRSDTMEDILHLILTRRKQSRWVKLGDKAEIAPVGSRLVLNDPELKLLMQAYEKTAISMNVGSDSVSLNPTLRGRLVKRFEELSGQRLSDVGLSSLLIQKRKQQRLPTLRKSEKDQKSQGGVGFSDIDLVG